jgi:hypothetical protein
MNSIIAIITALIVGGIGGWSVGNQSAPAAPEQRMNMENRAMPDDSRSPAEADTMPIAEDFVSLRPAVESLPSESLSEEEQAGLLFMREEEKLARDVYYTLYEKWGLQIFSNIAQSEQTHTEAVRNLLEKYDVSDPVTNEDIGVFANSDLQTLYNDLVERGSASIEEALRVGALIEDLDINDLNQEIAKADNEDIILVYENLTRGSRNHLRSFVSQLTARGDTYTPEYITQAEYDEILSAATERGNMQSGNGARGGGNGNNGGGNR